MPACKNRLNYFLLWLLLLLPFRVQANLAVEHAHVRLQDTVYQLDARINYDLSNITREALHHGLALTFVLTIKVEKNRWYMWDKPILHLTQRYELRYYALSDQYSILLLSDKPEAVPELFPSLSHALQQLGHIHALPLLEIQEVDNQATYRVYLQTYLDIEALPAPLRPVAYMSQEWRLSSEWYSCPLVSTR